MCSPIYWQGNQHTCSQARLVCARMYAEVVAAVQKVESVAILQTAEFETFFAVQHVSQTSPASYQCDGTWPHMPAHCCRHETVCQVTILATLWSHGEPPGPQDDPPHTWAPAAQCQVAPAVNGTAGSTAECCGNLAPSAEISMLLYVQTMQAFWTLQPPTSNQLPAVFNAQPVFPDSALTQLVTCGACFATMTTIQCKLSI